MACFHGCSSGDKPKEKYKSPESKIFLVTVGQDVKVRDEQNAETVKRIEGDWYLISGERLKELVQSATKIEGAK